MEVSTIQLRGTMDSEALEAKIRNVQSYLRPVETRNEEGKRFVVDTLTGRAISEVSDRYRLVTNAEVVQPFVDAFGYEGVNLRSFANGKNLIAKIKTGRRFDFGGGDVLDEQVVIQNSYDKSKSFSFRMGAFRWVCSNGLYIGRSVVEFKKIHTGEIPVAEVLRQSMEAIQNNNFNRWQQFQETPLTVKEEQEIVKGFECFEVKEETEPKQWQNPGSNRVLNTFIKRHADYLVAREPKNDRDALDNPRNGWGLYNQINRAITRALPANAVQKNILGNNNAEEYLAKIFGVN